jgi:hypothetical protein
MQIETGHSNQTDTREPLWPALVALLCALLSLIFGRELRAYQSMKLGRDYQPNPNWRDGFDQLRVSEWVRACQRAHGAAQILANKPLDLSTLIPIPMPATFGGPCPATPQAYLRRLNSITTWALDPHADIRRHAQRIAKRANNSGCPLRHAASQRATSPALRAEEENHRSLSSSNAQRWGRWIAASSRRDGGGSRRLVVLAQARAPPTLSPTADCPLPIASARIARENAPACPETEPGHACPTCAARFRPH